MSRPLDIFTHIPKAGGTTLTEILRAEYGSRHLFIRDRQPIAEWPGMMEALPGRIRVVAGHVRYGVHRYTARECRYFTLLRRPVERMVSALGYVRRQPAHPWHGHVTAGPEGVREFIRRHRNFQVETIAGVDLPAGLGDAEKLALAKENLATRYAAFGLLERFDESLLLIGEALGWGVHRCAPQNVAPEREELAAETRAALVEENRTDEKLYAFAEELLARRLAAQPPAWAERLARLRAPAGTGSRLWRALRNRLPR